MLMEMADLEPVFLFLKLRFMYIIIYDLYIDYPKIQLAIQVDRIKNQS